MSAEKAPETTEGQKRAAALVEAELREAGFKVISWPDGTKGVLNASRKWCAFLANLTEAIGDVLDEAEAAKSEDRP